MGAGQLGERGRELTLGGVESFSVGGSGVGDNVFPAHDRVLHVGHVIDFFPGVPLTPGVPDDGVDGHGGVGLVPVVEPPVPAAVVAVSRHRLVEGGGGLGVVEPGDAHLHVSALHPLVGLALVAGAVVEATEKFHTTGVGEGIVHIVLITLALLPTVEVELVGSDLSCVEEADVLPGVDLEVSAIAVSVYVPRDGGRIEEDDVLVATGRLLDVAGVGVDVGGAAAGGGVAVVGLAAEIARNEGRSIDLAQKNQSGCAHNDRGLCHCIF